MSALSVQRRNGVVFFPDVETVEFCQIFAGFSVIAVACDPMPSEGVETVILQKPLGVDLRRQFRAAPFIIVDIGDGFPRMNRECFCTGVDLYACHRFPERHQRLDRGPLLIFGVRADDIPIGRAIRSEYVVRCDAVGVDDLVGGGIDDGIGNIGGLPGQITEQQLAERGVRIGFADVSNDN